MKKNLALTASLFTMVILSGCAGYQRSPTLPGDSITDPLLRSDVARMILAYSKSMCKEPISEHKLVTTRVVPGSEGPGKWQEIWSVKACGKVTDYKIDFQRHPRGGTLFQISMK